MKTQGTGYGKGHGSNTPSFPVIRQIDNHPRTAAQFAAADRVETYKMGKVHIILTHDDLNGYILSVSRTDRLPNWDEVAHVRYALLPDDLLILMALPAKKDYINIHNFCFLLHELKHWTSQP